MMFNKDKFKEETKSYRRYLHQIPEIGFCEIETSKYIKERLKEFGYKVREVAKTGVIAFREGGNSDESIAFRADIDGLKITEETNLPYESKNYDHMHACGHDGHMAILLGFAHHVAEIGALNKGIVFIFQPAEEGPGGAKVIVDEGILKEYNVKHVFGLHLFPGLNEGEIGVKSGAVMARTGEFDIDIKAESGHGAIPHKANDGIIVAAQLINSYQSIISRNVNPIEGAVLTIGTINGGERRNIIAENVRLEGTLRAFDKEVYTKIKERMKAINRGLEVMFNVNINTEFRDMYPAVVNDRKLLKEIMKFLPEDKVIEIDPMMISEDFSYYQEVVPSIFFFLGIKNESLGFIHQLHSSKFNFNEDVLVDGIEMYHKICVGLNVY